MTVRNIKERDIKASRNLKSIVIAYQQKTGKKQEQIATELNMSQGNLSAYMNAHNKISLDNLFMFCNFFNCKPSDIVEELK